MAQDRIQLRGHHIGTFAVHYWGNDFYNPRYRGLFLEKEDKFFYKKFNKLPILEDKWDELSSQPKDAFTAIYGERIKNLVDTLYAILQTRPDLEVEIVGGLDSVCKAGCPRLQPSCAQSSSDNEDALALETYGLEVGRTYRARDIVQRVRDFTMRTGIRSPRDIQLARIGRVDALLK